MNDAQRAALAALKVTLTDQQGVDPAKVELHPSIEYSGDPYDADVIATWGEDGYQGVAIDPEGRMTQGGGSYRFALDAFELWMQDWNRSR